MFIKRLRFFFLTLWYAFRRLFFGVNTSVGNIGIPPLIDEIEMFEDQIRTVLPINWNIDRFIIRPLYQPFKRLIPYVSDFNRVISLQTEWPGNQPQQAQIQLFLITNATPIPPNYEVLGRWRRFTVVAQPPESIRIDAMFFSWSTFPGWPSSREDIISVLS